MAKNADGEFLAKIEANLNNYSPQEIKVANYSRNQALLYASKANYGRALAHLFVALRLIPEWRKELHNNFWQALSFGCQELVSKGRLHETISLRQDALLLYPDDEMMLMDLGSTYFKYWSIIMSSPMSMWLEILNGLTRGNKKKRCFKYFIANLIAVSEGLRTGFLNDRHPILSLADSKALITVLKDKKLIKQTVNVLNIGNRETLFVNVEILHEFVTLVPPNFGLVDISESIPKFLPYTSDVVVKLVALMVDCFENFHQSSVELFVQPTDEISGSTLIGFCLGYPIIYHFQSDLSFEELIQFEIKAKFMIPEISSVNLFSFTVPRCLEFEVVPNIDLWHCSLISKISPSSLLVDISIDKKYINAKNVVF